MVEHFAEKVRLNKLVSIVDPGTGFSLTRMEGGFFVISSRVVVMVSCPKNPFNITARSCVEDFKENNSHTNGVNLIGASFIAFHILTMLRQMCNGQEGLHSIWIIRLRWLNWNDSCNAFLYKEVSSSLKERLFQRKTIEWVAAQNTFKFVQTTATFVRNTMAMMMLKYVEVRDDLRNNRF